VMALAPELGRADLLIHTERERREMPAEPGRYFFRDVFGKRVMVEGTRDLSRGEARPDSDVDLCIVSSGAEHQLAAARKLRHAMWDVWPRPSFTLVTISPNRLGEKRARDDHFFGTVLEEGILLATEN
jgi:predicted nucleotidyltransferase